MDEIGIYCLQWSPHGLVFQSWMKRNSANDLYVSTPRLGVLESPNHNCSTLTVPMSHWKHLAFDMYISTPRLGVLEFPNHICSTLTVPMSH
eukprot:scaffold25873_cov44-Cyclotella_meneghiniana.AAC.1